MATELDRLFVTLEADLTNFQAGMKRAGADVDTFARDTERKTGAAGKAIGDGMSKAGASVGMMNQQFTQLGYQLNDIGTSLASGASPFQVLAQQGGQVYQALSMNGGVGQGLANVKNALVEGATASRLLTLGLGGVAAAAVYAGFSYVGAQDDIKKGLQGIGAASGATVNDINEIAERLSAAKTISINAARDIATAIAATGKVGVGNIEGIAGLAPGFARLAGTDLQTAGAELAGLFADPVKGADEFIKKLGGINDQTRELIKNLTEQGKRQQAIVELQRAVKPQIDAAQDARSPARRAFDQAYEFGARQLDNVGRAVAVNLDTAGTPEDQLRDARAALARAQRQQQNGAGMLGTEDFGDADAEVRRLKQTVDELEASLRKAGEAGAAAANKIQGDEASRNAGAILRGLDPDGQRLEKAQNDLLSLGESIAKLNLDPSNANASELEKYVTKYGELKTRVDLLKEAYEKGGGAARQALVAADFSANTAGLSSYERGLRAIVQQYQEMARAAREAGNEAQAKTFEAAGTRMQDAYRTQNVERARGEISIPEDYYPSIRSAESGTNDRAVSETGAVGRYQFTKGTWRDLFQKVKSSRYAEIQGANTGADGKVDERAVDAAVLALRNDPGLQEEMVRALTARNAASLDRQGFAPTSRNLYAAHNIGPRGAEALLKAERDGRGGETAQSVLDPVDPALVSSNRSYYGSGKSVTEALAILEKKTQANGASARAAKEDVIATDAQTASMGRSAVEAARLKSANDDLREAREKGEEVGRIFKDGDDLLKRGSDGLTGSLKAQTDQFIANANARGRAVAVQLDTRFQQDQKAARDALGRTYEEQSAYSQARSYGAPGSAAFEQAKAGITEIQNLAEAKNYTSSFLKDLNRDLMQTGNLGKAALGALSNLLSRASDKAFDKIAASLFSTGGGGSGIFDAVGKFFTGGFAGGGYTGAGGRYEPAGIVHRGEVVFSQDDVRRHGGVGLVDAFRRGLPGFAKGGPVAMPSALPRIPSAVAQRASGSGGTDARSYAFDMRGSNLTEGQVRATVIQAISAHDAEINRTFGQRFAGWKEDA